MGALLNVGTIGIKSLIYFEESPFGGLTWSEAVV
jgi:hypothetical protein